MPASHEKKTVESNRHPDALYIEAEPRADGPWRLNIDEIQRGVSRARARARERARVTERRRLKKEKIHREKERRKICARNVRESKAKMDIHGAKM